MPSKYYDIFYQMLAVNAGATPPPPPRVKVRFALIVGRMLG
ncbi:hypothetical protein [Campylobacter upsaliensis]|nr:hypothetical protein [Campylobacter upsaliensis]